MKNEKLLNIKDVVERVGLKPEQIYKMVKLKQFPEFIELSVKNRLWKESMINEWINEKKVGGAV